MLGALSPAWHFTGRENGCQIAANGGVTASWASFVRGKDIYGRNSCFLASRHVKLIPIMKAVTVGKFYLYYNFSDYASTEQDTAL